MMDPSKLKVVELRAALSERGLDTKGNKPVLVERLRKALEEEEEEETQECGSALQTENIDDTALKETQERVTEAARSSQSPRTPSRASRSSSVTTPTKISTRNASRASTTPNSSKQSTPIKSQHGEKSAYEVLTNEEATTQQEEMAKLSPEKYTEEQQEDASNVLRNKIYSSDKCEEEETKPVNILEGNKYRENILQVPVTEPSEEPSTMAHLDQLFQHDPEGKVLMDRVRKIQQLFADSDNIAKREEKTEIKDEDKISIEEKDVEHREDGCNVKDNIDIPEEQPTHVILDQIDEMCELKQKSEEKIMHDDYKVQDKKIDISANVENLDEKVDDIDVSQEKQQKATLDAEEPNQMGYNDRKRKRSPSPAEVRQLSPVSQKTEDEPDFDESTVVLSWYDSDLNLIIDKDGFLSATPMHDGDFCDMWAGARASHGVLNGKVYYEVRITQHYPIITKDEKHSHMFRIGWSVPSTSMQLGEEKLSYAYTSAGQQGTDKKFTDYGSSFGKDDIVGCYLDMTSENTVELFYTVNGKNVGSAFSICKEDLGGRPLFPHILSKNCTFVCNFGQEKAWCEQIPGYILMGNIESKDRIAGPRRPDGKADCEVIMMCGLPAAGKTVWARKHAADHPDKLYNILAVHNLVEKTGDVALSDQEQNIRQREIIDKCNRALDQLIDVASGRRRNYILDQKSNVYSSVQRRKMRNFCGYQRKAIVVIPTNEEYNQRLSTHNAIEGNSEFSLTEMKANFSAPSVGEAFDAVEWVGLGEEEAKKLIGKYNKEGKDAGFSQQPPAKQPRLDKTESNKETRDSRNSRDRRNNYQDRGRNPSWRGSNMGGWRGERPPQRGGYMRHTSGYGPPVPWRLRGRGGPAMARGADRRMVGVDRRQGNDRNRSVAPRQGGWGPMSGNYQGSQQSSWGQQDNWSGSQATGNWNQQSGWGQQQQQQQWGGGWKSYTHQGTYSQAGYNQHGYGNGNWNSWNQQYYNNQYWGQQQQQSGQTTAASGQAVSKQ